MTIADEIPRPLYLCLDQGGHASRALVFADDGVVVAEATCAVATSHPTQDCVEQNPEEVVRSLQQVVSTVVSNLGARAADIQSAGLATQRSSIVCWDRYTGQALSPVLSWQDRRAHGWLQTFSAQADSVNAHTGLPLSAHYGASKLRWCLDHLEPVRAAQQTGRLVAGPLVSFLLFRLLEERPLVVDPSNAQRTLLWNIDGLNWDPMLLNLFGVPRDILPDSVPTRFAFGHLPVLDEGVPLIIATGDQAAALYAFGQPASSVVSVNMGTGAFVQRSLTESRRVKGLLTSVAALDAGRPTYTLEGTVNGAGSALAWAARTLNIPELEAHLPQWLAREIPSLLFLNGVGGLGAPYWAPNFPSRFVGRGEAWEQAVAVAESIVFLIAENLRCMFEVGHFGTILVTGGLARLDGLCQRLATLTGVGVSRPGDIEATARGLGVMLGVSGADWKQNVEKRFLPQIDSALESRYHQWRAVMESSLAQRH